MLAATRAAVADAERHPGGLLEHLPQRRAHSPDRFAQRLLSLQGVGLLTSAGACKLWTFSGLLSRRLPETRILKVLMNIAAWS